MSRILILSDRARFGNETSAGTLRNQCAFTSKDMGAEWADAFTYGIVMGWDAMKEIAALHGWDDELIAFIRDAHQRFKKLADVVEATTDGEKSDELNNGVG